MAEITVLPRPPSSPAEWDAYFDLRWRILRAPWGEPRGSERDSLEDSAIHLLVTDSTGRALACGRLHLNSPTEAQVRYMAVDDSVQGQGYGSAILAGLEAEAKRFGASRIVLNARDKAIKFYEKHGYTVIEEAETLFGAVRHVRMGKSIR
jgi:N-acetylglutamate synthase-like GNAT family acetyltransferase